MTTWLRQFAFPLTVLFIFGVGISVFAQSGTRGSGTRVIRSRPTPDQFAAQFWTFLTRTSPYRRWAAFPGKDAELYEGESPHGAHLRMYANGAVVKDPKNVPSGSIIVKENYGEDKTTLMAVTVMYRSRGFDPEHANWYYIKYNPDGSVAKTPADKGSKPIYGRFQSCINCHEGADGGDFVFAND